MSRELLLALLGERIGVDPGSLGDRVLDHSLAEAQRRLGLPTLDALASRVAIDRAALAELIEQVVVGETWFFRVPQQFDDLVRFARTTARRRRPLRVLSLPCASGEEAWSAAISLLEAGLGCDEFEVVGIDVSAPLVARASAGVYRGNAMRIPAAREPWLEPIDGGVEVSRTMRQCVRFRVGNALDSNLLADEAPFDVAFCRNLLIYLTADAREQVLATLRAGLASPGLVLAGQAEVLTAMTSGFQVMPQGSPLSYLFGAGPNPRSTAAAPNAAIEVARPRLRIVPALPQAPATVPSDDAIAATVIEDPVESAMALAQRLADSGDLAGARDACRGVLKSSPQDVQAHYLLGIVESARGDVEAADTAFARVLFLDRDHTDALEHRAMLAERLGRGDEARRLRARAVRSRAPRTPSAP